MNSHWLSPSQRNTLLAICATLAPPDGPSAADIATQAIEALRTRPPTEQREFQTLLRILDSPIADFNPFDRRSFVDRSPDEREALLKTYATSRLHLRRKGFQTLKRLVHFLSYALTPDGAPNPIWSTLEYPGPLSDPPTQPVTRIRPLSVVRDRTLTCDVVVVGSGAGGGVAAGVLAGAGLDVVVLEKGEFVAEDAFTQRELEMTERLFEARGLLTTNDLGVVVLAGSCLGGGTVVNWSASFRTPDRILEEWACDHDLPYLREPEFGRHFDAVTKRLHVTTDESPCNPQNEALLRGCTALGWHVKPIPRNVRECVPDECSYCTFGCQRRAKQSTLRTYLADAAAAGARIVPRCTVRHVAISRGTATGVRAVVSDDAGDQHALTVRARAVVVAAGAIHSPALLRRSGIDHPHLGRHLHFHPTIPVTACYDEPIDPWRGVPMAAISTEFAYLDGAYGIRLETPPVHPGMMALGAPWGPNGRHGALMRRARSLGTFIALVRDRDGGRVTLDEHGDPVLHYRISDYDRRHLVKGVEAALRVHLAAGAHEFIAPGPILRTVPATEAAIEELTAEVRTWDGRPNWLPLFTAHQMSTCRMGGRRRDHVVAPTGEVWDVQNLYVADASTFPASSGVNPMLSIQALAHHVADGLRTRLA